MFFVLKIIAFEWGTSNAQNLEDFTCNGESIC